LLVDEFAGSRSCQGVCMFSDGDVRLICPHCRARFVVRPEPGETVVLCPNPDCAKPIDVSSQEEEPEDYSSRLSRRLWPFVAVLLLAVPLCLFKGC
jgi:hypothetical protein